MRKLNIGILAAIILLLMVFSPSVFGAGMEMQTEALGNAGESIKSSTASTVGVTYRTHVQNVGWETTWAANGASAGTQGYGLRLEGIEIKLTGDFPDDGKIEYRTQVENMGWEKYWASDGVTSGSQGMGLRLEGIQIRLVNMPDYTIEYRTHVQNLGWETTWASDGEIAGTVGKGLRLEGIQIRIIKNNADLTEYNKLLTTIKNAKEADYTSYSWNNLATVMAANVVTVKNTQTAVDTATEAIKTAYDALESEALGMVYSTAGTYGPSTGMETVNKDVFIKASGVTLQNLYIKGDLIISEEVGQGEATLNNITVAGETYVRGGGKNSIHINNGSYRKITIQQTSSGQVRIVAQNASGLDVVISDDAEGENVILEGVFDTVEVDAPDMNISTQGSTVITKMTMGKVAKGSVVSLATSTRVDRMVINGTTDVKGQGRIVKADVNADNVTYEKAPELQTVGATVKVPPTAPAVTVAVTGITVNSTNSATTVSAGGTLQMSAVVTPANATNNKVTWSVDKGTGTATIDTTGLLTAVSAGTVTVKATARDGSSVTGTKILTINTLPTANIKASSATIINGTSNPDIVLNLTDDTFTTVANLVDNWEYDLGTTGLKITSIEISSTKTKAVIKTEGEATAGTLTLKAKNLALAKGSASGTVTITVPSVAVTSISVIGSSGNTTISKDKGTLQMVATIIPSAATNKEVTWLVSNGTGAATIDSSGVLAALRNGTVTVTATAADGSKKIGTCTVTISNQTESTINTATTIENGAVDPIIIVTLANDTFTDTTNQIDNWGISLGTTGLDVTSIELNTNKKQVNIKTKGVASAGVIAIQAKEAALSRVGVSNEITIVVPGIPVTEASISGGTTVGSVLTAGTKPSAATVSYQWLRADTVDGKYTNISGATSATYTTDINDVNKYIKVTVTGTGKYTKTVSSSATGPLAIVPVTAITVTGKDNVTSITTDDGTLQMSASVVPSNATYKDVIWSVEAGTGMAEILPSGLVMAISNGTVTIKATARDSAIVFGTIVLSLSNQKSSIATIDSGTLAGKTIDGTFTGGNSTDTSSALTVTIPYENKLDAPLILNKKNDGANIYYVKGTTKPTSDVGFADTYTTGSKLLVDNNDVIWLLVISEDLKTKKYYKITVTVSAALSTDARLTSVAAQKDDSPGAQTGADTGTAIAWEVIVPNSQSTLALTDIVSATSATFKLYSNSAFTTEITSGNTLPLAVGNTVAYIKVTAQNVSVVKYYAVTIKRTALPATATGQFNTFTDPDLNLPNPVPGLNVVFGTGTATIDLSAVSPADLNAAAGSQSYPGFKKTETELPVWADLRLNKPAGATDATLYTDGIEDYYDFANSIFYVTVGNRRTATGVASAIEADYKNFVPFTENKTSTVRVEWKNASGVVFEIQELTVTVKVTT